MNVSLFRIVMMTICTCAIGIPANSAASAMWSATETAAPESQASTPVESHPGEIVVEGERKKQREAVREFAKAVTRRPRVDLPVERFRQPVCLLIYGLKPRFAEIITKRISQNARHASLSVAAGKDCRPNIYVLFVRDIDADMRRMKNEGGVLFEQLLDYQIDRVLDESGPVRAWDVAEVRDERGIPMPSDSQLKANVNKPGASTRLRLPVTMETMASIVVIDVSALGGKSLAQLADYATMRVLAPTQSIDEPQSARFDTILTLFSGQAPPAEMTAFDRAYLRAIYNSAANLHPDALYQQVALELEHGERGD